MQNFPADTTEQSSQPFTVADSFSAEAPHTVQRAGH